MKRKDFNNLLTKVPALTNQQKIELADKMFGNRSTDNYNQTIYYTDLEILCDKTGRNRYRKLKF